MSAELSAASILIKQPTNYRISTITGTGFIGTEINLEVLYNNIHVNSTKESDCNLINQIIYVEYGKKKSESSCKGFNRKAAINRRKEKKTKRFDNQLTIVYIMILPDGTKSNLNIKVFRNGKIQITGIKKFGQGEIVLKIVEDVIRDIHINKDKSIIDDIDKLCSKNFRIQLINSDYKVGFEIKRENLYNLMSSGTISDVICSYEPCIYPGVKIQFFWNPDKHEQDGICACPQNCGMRSDRSSVKNCICKKVTIAVFQSGCIIITGSQITEQIVACYDFINSILYQNKIKVEKKNIQLLRDKKILIKKSLISF